MPTPPIQPLPRAARRRQSGTSRAALAGVLATAFLLAGLVLAQEAPKAAPQPTAPATERLDEKEERFVELGLGQLRRLEKSIRQLDEQRLGAGSLAAAALAAQSSRPADPAAAVHRADALRWIPAALDGCGSRWPKHNCERTQIALQRVALQYPEILPPALRRRLREEAAVPAPPPTPEALRDPWAFKETENQRIVRIAASVVGHGLAGSSDTPAGKAWTQYALAFLEAHDREGWYEAESPGYLYISMTALLHLADHAPQEEVRASARRQLDLLFADWAQKQVGGFPAGVKSRTYVHWALGARNTPWVAWAWLLAGFGEPGRINFMDWPELAVSGYRPPDAVIRLLTGRRGQPPYEILARRTLQPGHRQTLNTATYSYATPDYVVGAAQSVGGLGLTVSGGQEIMATLFAECHDFAPVYLWSRNRNPRSDRWKSWAGRDLAVGSRNVVLARLGAQKENTGHAYLAPPWSAPEAVSEDVVVSRCGDTYLALATTGGWNVAPAQERFPEYYAGDRNFAGSWAAVPRRQPADVAMEVGRRAEHGSYDDWKKRAVRARLVVEDGEQRFAASDGTPFTFVPGERATVGGRPLDPRDYPLLAGPFLSSRSPGTWTFSFGEKSYRFEPLMSDRRENRGQQGELRE